MIEEAVMVKGQTDFQLSRTFTLGLDVIAQYDATTTDRLMFLYDAHGSTRALVDSGALIVRTFNYDAYGNAINFDASAALTSLLYSGEQFDINTGLSYLRARYYDPANGRFTRMDPWEGDVNNPLGLHKYGYVHGNPIWFDDPSGLTGEFSIGGLLSATAIRKYLYGALINYGIGKAIEATTSLVFHGNLQQFHWFETWDLLNFVPGAVFAGVGKVGVQLGGSFLKSTAQLLRLTGTGRKAVGALVALGSHYLDDTIRWFTTAVANSRGVLELTTAYGRVVSIGSGRRGFRHFIERHLAQYFNGERAGLTHFWPAGTTPAQVLTYAEEAIGSITGRIVPNELAEQTLSNGIRIGYRIDEAGRLFQFYPIDGPGVTNALEAINLLHG